jgi:hypothetical protein
MIFIDFVLQWHNFFSTLATACATLIGLLFVAMTLSANTLNAEENGQLMRVARDTLGHFLVVLMTSVMFLVPYLPSGGLAVALFIIAIPWTISATRRCISVFQTRRQNVYSRNLLQSSGLSVFGGIGLTAVAILVVVESTGALYLLVSVFATLLAAATSTAWFLLSRMRGTSR